MSRVRVGAAVAAVLMAVSLSGPVVPAAASTGRAVAAGPVDAALIVEALEGLDRPAVNSRSSAGSGARFDLASLPRDGAGRIDQSQSGGTVSVYDDFCADATGGAADSRSTGVFRPADQPDFLIFELTMCETFSVSAMPADGFIAFLMDMGIDGDGWDYAAALSALPGSPDGLAFDVFRVPNNNDVSTWSTTWQEFGQQPLPNLIGSFAPISALGGRAEFAMTQQTFYGSGREDLLPQVEELEFGSLVYPNPCQSFGSGTNAAAQMSGRGHSSNVKVDAVSLPVVRGLLDAAGLQVSGLLDAIGWLIVDAPAADVGRVLRMVPGVEVLDAVPVVKAQVTPNDPEYGGQWALPAVGAPDAWMTGTGSAAVTVAVIDDGVDGRLPDFAGRMVAGFNAITGQATGTNNARGSHGTAVASVLAATGNDGGGIAGLDWAARIMPIGIFDANSCSFDFDSAAAIVAAADAGVDVVNMSFGSSGGGTQVMEDAIAYAVARGVILISSSGNFGPNAGVGFPASHPDVIAVGATDINGQVTTYSQTGPQVEVVAPGGESQPILVLAPNFDGVTRVNGTSFSAPLVAGAATLWTARYPGGTPQQFREALQRSAVDGGAPGFDEQYGHGLLDVAAVVAGGQQVTETVNQEQLIAGDAIDLAVEVSQRRFSGQARHAVLSRNDNFADSLAGSALSGQGPLLYSGSGQLDGRTAAELGRVLPAGATVYLLGGPAALSDTVAQQVAQAGFQPVRLSGAGRVQTAIAIANEAFRTGSPARIALARDDAWADSVSAGAWAAATGQPILITNGQALNPDLAAWLAQSRVSQSVAVLGGTAAVSDQVAAEAGRLTGTGFQRISGSSRDDTAVAITQTLGQTAGGAVVIPGYSDSGWAAGLAVAGLAGIEGRGVLVGNDRLSPATGQVLSGIGCPGVLQVGTAGQWTAAADAAISLACRP